MENLKLWSSCIEIEILSKQKSLNQNNLESPCFAFFELMGCVWSYMSCHVFSSSLCRQVLLGMDEMVGVYELDEGYVRIKVTGDEDVDAALVSYRDIFFAREHVMEIFQSFIKK